MRLQQSSQIYNTCKRHKFLLYGNKALLVGVLGICLKRMVGASGFEPPASWSRTRRASQAALRPDGRHPGAIKPARVEYQNSIARCLYLEFGTMAQRIKADCPVTVRDRLNREPRATAQRRSPESQTRPVTLQALHVFIYCLPRRTQI